MKHAIPMAALTALTLGLAGPAAAAETSLIFATTSPPMSGNNKSVFHPWAAHITQQGKGVVKIDARDGTALANKRNFYPRVLNDVVQISFGAVSYVGGKFPRSSVVNLPYLAGRSTEASVAFWRLYKTGALDAEYNEVVPLYFVMFSQQSVHLARPLKSIDEVKGLRVITAGKVESETATHLGMVPLTLSAPQVYEALQRHTADGVIFPWATFNPFHLADVTTYHIETTLGGGGPGMVFMAKKRYAALPAAARKIIDENSGEKETRHWGVFTDELADGIAKRITKIHTVVHLTKAQEAEWRAKTAPVIASWTKSTPDGAKILAAYRKLLDEASHGM